MSQFVLVSKFIVNVDLIAYISKETDGRLTVFFSGTSNASGTLVSIAVSVIDAPAFLGKLKVSGDVQVGEPTTPLFATHPDHS